MPRIRSANSVSHANQLGRGIGRYLPEDFYFREDTDLDIDSAVRVTAKFVSAWTDSYTARLLHKPSSHRSGSVPEQEEPRHLLIDNLIDWLMNESASAYNLSAFALYKADKPLLDQHDGIPGDMFLTKLQFADLQNEWERYSLPRNLYYPAAEQHTMVEPAYIHGGIVRIRKHYSPMLWVIRNQSPEQLLTVPDEETRAARFDSARQQFTEAILLRIMELREPGNDVNMNEIEKLARLIRAVNNLGDFAS